MSNPAIPWGRGKMLVLAGLWIASVSAGVSGQTPPVPPPSVPPRTVGEPAPGPATVVAADAPTAREAALEARIQQLEQMVQQLSVQMSQRAPTAAAPADTPDGSATANAGGNPGGNATTAVPSGRGRRSAGPVLSRQPAALEAVQDAPGLRRFPPDREIRPGFRIQDRGRGVRPPVPQPDPGGLPVLPGRRTEPQPRHLGHPPPVVHVQRPDHQALGILRLVPERPRHGQPCSTSSSTPTSTTGSSSRSVSFKTPFTYEFYHEPIQGLVNPERSLFFNNFALRPIGRRPGLQGPPVLSAARSAAGLRRRRLQRGPELVRGYPATPRASWAFVNWRPFAQFEDTPLENFVFGGSVQAGTQTNLPLPATLRTVVATAGSSVNGVPFLTFNSNVRESGPRAFWDLHAAWYYKHLSLISEWQSGYQDYALTTNLAAPRPARHRELLRPGRLLHHRRDRQQPERRQAAQGLRHPPRQARSRCDRAHRPVQRAQPHQERLHRRTGRPEHLGQQPLHDRSRYQLVSDPVHQDLVHLAERGLRKSRPVQPDVPPEDE